MGRRDGQMCEPEAAAVPVDDVRARWRRGGSGADEELPRVVGEVQ